MIKTKNKPGIHLHKTEPKKAKTIDLYKPEYYWNIIASNGREIARSSETYTRKAGAVNSIKTAANLFHVSIQFENHVYYDHSKKDCPLQSYL